MGTVASAVAPDSMRAPASKGTPIIEVKDLHKIYQSAGAETHALQGISFSVYPGDFIAIIGPSGSGKSTLMNILGCLDTPTSGICRIGGQDVADLDSDQLARLRREQVGFVFPHKPTPQALSLERSQPCDWHNLSQLTALISLYLSNIVYRTLQEHLQASCKPWLANNLGQI